MSMQLEDDNTWYCTNCKRQRLGTIKKLTLSSLPDILIIHLKRFKQVRYTAYCRSLAIIKTLKSTQFCILSYNRKQSGTFLWPTV